MLHIASHHGVWVAAGEHPHVWLGVALGRCGIVVEIHGGGAGSIGVCLVVALVDVVASAAVEAQGAVGIHHMVCGVADIDVGGGVGIAVGGGVGDEVGKVVDEAAVGGGAGLCGGEVAGDNLAVDIRTANVFGQVVESNGCYHILLDGVFNGYAACAVYNVVGVFVLGQGHGLERSSVFVGVAQGCGIVGIGHVNRSGCCRPLFAQGKLLGGVAGLVEHLPR